MSDRKHAVDNFLGRMGTKNNVDSSEGNHESTNESTKIERKRVSFDIREDLHKELKILSVQTGENMYEIIEKAIDNYLH